MTTEEQKREANKNVVRRFNEEFIVRGDNAAFRELMMPTFVNRTAPPGTPNGPESMAHTFNEVIRPAFPDLTVEIHEQIAEGDKVTTRKTIRGTHRGELFGIAPTGERVEIQVIDIVRVENGKYAEHWGINTLPTVLQQLRAKS